MNCCCDVGSFVYHNIYGYGEITTVSEDGSKVFIDFRKGHCDWFSRGYLRYGSDVFPAEDNAFIRVLFGKGENKGLGIKDILQKYKGYHYVDILF